MSLLVRIEPRLEGCGCGKNKLPPPAPASNNTPQNQPAQVPQTTTKPKRTNPLSRIRRLPFLR